MNSQCHRLLKHTVIQQFAYLLLPTYTSCCRCFNTGKSFVSATDFVAHVKRQRMSDRQREDSWKSVHVGGVPLSKWQAKHLERLKKEVIALEQVRMLLILSERAVC